MKKVYILSACLCLAIATHAQTTHYTTADYSRKPVWIEMIKDTSANFFETEKAFKAYFQHHEQPNGEHDVIGERAEREKHPSKRKRQKLEAENRMRIEVKKYEHWHDKMLPYVQEDGSILTPAQRLKIWNDTKGNK